MKDGQSYIKMHPCIKPNSEKEGRGDTALQAIDDLDEMVVGESKALKEVKDVKFCVCGFAHPKHPNRMVIQKQPINKDKVMQQH